MLFRGKCQPQMQAYRTQILAVLLFIDTCRNIFILRQTNDLVHRRNCANWLIYLFWQAARRSGWPSYALQLSFQRDNTGLANYQSYHYFWSSSPGFPWHIEAQSHNLLPPNLFYTGASSCLRDWICFQLNSWNLFTLKNTALHCTAEKAMAPHSSALAWRIPWTEEPGRLQSMG